MNEWYHLEMPTCYSTVHHEFDAAVNDVALIDRSWIGRIEVTGQDRIDLLHQLSTNNLLSGKPGEIISTVFTTDKGRIVDHVYVCFRDSSLLLLISPTNEERFTRWIDKYTIMEDIRLKVVTHATAQFSLIGPRAKQLTESIIFETLTPNRFVEPDILASKAIVVYRNDFETEMIDFVVEASSAREVWSFLSSGNEKRSATKMGTRAYEVFRISRGIPAIGAELSDRFNPYEVGLRNAISFTKGCYIGQEVIARLDTYQKIQKCSVGVVLDSSVAVNAGSLVLQNENELGVITSLSEEMIRGSRAGIGVLKKGSVSADDNISVVSENKSALGVLRQFPVVL